MAGVGPPFGRCFVIQTTLLISCMPPEKHVSPSLSGLEIMHVTFCQYIFIPLIKKFSPNKQTGKRKTIVPFCILPPPHPVASFSKGDGETSSPRGVIDEHVLPYSPPH